MKTKIGVFWDAQNCKLSGRNILSGVLNVTTTLTDKLPNAEIGEFYAYINSNDFTESERESLKQGGVKLVDVESGVRNAADRKLIIGMFEFVMKNPPPCFIVLISADADFTRAISSIGGAGYTTILLHPEKEASRVLKGVHDYKFFIGSVFRGQGLISSTSSSSTVFLQQKPPASHVQHFLGPQSMAASVHWDTETCVVEEEGHIRVIEEIKQTVSKKVNIDVKKMSFNAYGTKSELPCAAVRKRANIQYHQTSRITKADSLENQLIVNMLSFGYYNPMQCIILISNNKVFANVLQFLKARGFKTYVVVPRIKAEKELLESETGTLLSMWPPKIQTRFYQARGT